jgi:hypothetical protein
MRRAASLFLLGFLALGFAAAAGAAALDSDPCCASMADVDAAPCQSFSETQCCDTPLALQQAGKLPAVPCAGAACVAAWPGPSPAHASLCPRPPAAPASAAFLGSVVLRL